MGFTVMDFILIDFSLIDFTLSEVEGPSFVGQDSFTN